MGLAEDIVEGNASRRDIQEARERLSNAKPRRKKEVSRQYKLMASAGDSRGVIKEWDSGRVCFEIQCRSTEERERLVQELLERFSEGDESIGKDTMS